ncbi:hypothetical protein [Streptosporangium jomthongense]|uniref:DprA-like DNA processing chain A n=1 Tax=Streptosporangium jomthongense TaxID=1193683 RepID=A0ABV8FA22_9ACTN
MIYRVLITGSRSFADITALEHAMVDTWHDATQLGGELLVVHGACYPPKRRDGKRPNRSADWLAHIVCLAYGIPEEPHPADWDSCSRLCPPKPHRRTRQDGTTYCPIAGLARNQDMVDEGAHLCIAAPQGPSYGTRDCMRRAAEAGVEVLEVAA